MSNWIVNAVESMGYAGIAFLMFLENLLPPIPSELIMPLAGYLAAKGKLSIVWAIVAGVVGSVAGQVLLYFIAKKLGEKRIREWAGKHGRWATMSPEDVDKSAKWFHDKGVWAVLVGRCVPGLRSLISIPAGISEMPFATFLLCTTIGATIWTSALAFAGQLLGSQFGNIEQYLSPVTWGILGLALAVYLYRVITFKPKDDSKDPKSQGNLRGTPAH